MCAILVTGAGGFIGSRVAAHLQGRGWDVRGLVRASSTSTEGQVPVVYGDLVDEQSLAAATKGVDVVIHCAGLVHQPSATMEEHLRVNVEGTRSLLRQAIRNGAKQFILMSSIAVYGKASEPHHETDDPKPVTPYGRAKLQAEEVCREMATQEGLPLIILRLSTVYGEAESGNLNRLIRAVDKVGPIVIGNGQNAKSMTYVANVAELCDRIVTNYGQATLACNVADPHPYTLHEIVETIEKALGRGREVRFASQRLCLLGSYWLLVTLRAVGRASPVTPQHVRTIIETSTCDVSHLRQTLCFEAPILLEEGLGITVNWYNATKSRGREGCPKNAR